MSNKKPHSLLAFIYNTTIDPPYRLEMHTDMEIAFRRFEVSNEGAQLSCYNVEQAAYRLRASSSDVGAGGDRDPAQNRDGANQMASSTRALFTQLRTELVAGVLNSQNGSIAPNRVSLSPSLDAVKAAGAPADAPWSAVSMGAQGVVVQRDATWLEYAYFFLHFPEARPAILQILQSSGPAQTQSVVAQTFSIFDRALSRSLDDAAAVAEAADTLCRALQQEYETLDWKRCW